MCDVKSLPQAVVAFIDLPGIKRFLSKFGRDRQLLFMHYCLLYLKMHQPACKFEINVTDRYSQKVSRKEKSQDTKLEGCVVSRHMIPKGEPIAYLEGWLAQLEDEIDQSFKDETDFSIIQTPNGYSNLLLGPARFVNHDCNPNSAFSRRGKHIYLRAIKDIYPGQEVTVAYAKNYFGDNNRECCCVSCEVSRVNGFESPTETPPEEEPNDINTKALPARRKSPRRNVVVTDDRQEFSDNSFPGTPVQSPFSQDMELTTPSPSVEPDAGPAQEVPLKLRLRQTDQIGIAVEDRLFKFSFEGDDELFTNTRKDFKLVCRSLSKEARDIYTLTDYILKKLSILRRFKDMQRFYYLDPIENDSNLTLDCVNCFTPFFGPNENIAPRKLPTRMCPRCHRHAVLYNAYWPSIEHASEKIELLREWDFTSLKNVGARGEFHPPTKDEIREHSEPAVVEHVSSKDQESDHEDEVMEHKKSINDRAQRAARRHEVKYPIITPVKTKPVERTIRTEISSIPRSSPVPRSTRRTRNSSLDPRTERRLKRIHEAELATVKRKRKVIKTAHTQSSPQSDSVHPTEDHAETSDVDIHDFDDIKVDDHKEIPDGDEKSKIRDGDDQIPEVDEDQESSSVDVENSNSHTQGSEIAIKNSDFRDIDSPGELEVKPRSEASESPSTVSALKPQVTPRNEPSNVTLLTPSPTCDPTPELALKDTQSSPLFNEVFERSRRANQSQPPQNQSGLFSQFKLASYPFDPVSVKKYSMPKLPGPFPAMPKPGRGAAPGFYRPPPAQHPQYAPPYYQQPPFQGYPPNPQGTSFNMPNYSRAQQVHQHQYQGRNPYQYVSPPCPCDNQLPPIQPYPPSSYYPAYPPYPTYPSQPQQQVSPQTTRYYQNPSPSQIAGQSAPMPPQSNPHYLPPNLSPRSKEKP